MLTKTTESAIRTLIYLVMQWGEGPIALRHIADELALSPTYLAKVTNQLVKAGILHAHRGAHGGVRLGHPAKDITLQQIVEACQGQVIGDYCTETKNQSGVCAFHRAMFEMHQATIQILSCWTLADLAAHPGPSGPNRHSLACRMAKVCPLEIVR